MTVDAEQVKDFHGHVNTRPVQLRKLAAAFRRGATLHESELKILRDYAAENGLARPPRASQDRTEEPMTVQAVTPQAPKPTGGLIFWQGWRNSPKGRHTLYVAAHALFIALAVSYVWAATSLVS
jgi:hypothetical protein